MNFSFVRYHSDSGFRHGIAATGRKYIYFICPDTPFRAKRLNLEEARYMTPLGDSKRVRAEALKLKRIAKRVGCSDSTKRLLDRARKA